MKRIFIIFILGLFSVSFSQAQITTTGNAYCQLSYQPAFRGMSGDEGYTIVAVENNTTIYEDGIMKSVLNKGQVYSSYFTDDATGKYITADNPVAYFVTNKGAIITLYYREVFSEKIIKFIFVVIILCEPLRSLCLYAEKNQKIVRKRTQIFL